MKQLGVFLSLLVLHTLSSRGVHSIASVADDTDASLGSARAGAALNLGYEYTPTLQEDLQQQDLQQATELTTQTHSNNPSACTASAVKPPYSPRFLDQPYPQYFGYAAALDGKGARVLIGAPRYSTDLVSPVYQVQGQAFVYTHSGKGCTFLNGTELPPPAFPASGADGTQYPILFNFGERVALSEGAEAALVGTSYPPVKYRFTAVPGSAAQLLLGDGGGRGALMKSAASQYGDPLPYIAEPVTADSVPDDASEVSTAAVDIVEVAWAYVAAQAGSRKSSKARGPLTYSLLSSLPLASPLPPVPQTTVFMTSLGGLFLSSDGLTALVSWVYSCFSESYCRDLAANRTASVGGTAQVFRRSSVQERFTASVALPAPALAPPREAMFGIASALSSDGSTAAVASLVYPVSLASTSRADRLSVSVYKRQGSRWVLAATLDQSARLPTDGLLQTASYPLALTANGKHLAVTVTSADAAGGFQASVVIYRSTGASNYVPGCTLQLANATDLFSIKLVQPSPNKLRLLAGGSTAASIWSLKVSGGSCPSSPQLVIRNPNTGQFSDVDGFGCCNAVDITPNGRTTIVGAPYNLTGQSSTDAALQGAAYLFST